MQGDLYEDRDGANRRELDPLVREAVARAFDQSVPEESLQRALRRFEAIGRPSATKHWPNNRCRSRSRETSDESGKNRSLTTPATLKCDSNSLADPNRERHVWWFALAGAAAVLLLAGVVWRTLERRPSPPPVDITNSTQTVPTLQAEPMVTLQTYRLVHRDRPDELMTLLDQHAAAVLPAVPEDPEPWPARWRPLSRHEDWEDMP